MEDTQKAVDSLESNVLDKSSGLSCAAFSQLAKVIRRVAPEILAKCGIERDASVFPAMRFWRVLHRLQRKYSLVILKVTLKSFQLQL